MKAVGLYRYLPVEHEQSLIDLELKAPTAAQLDSHDVLVEVRAISVNPIDTKIRKSKAEATQHPHILGWDAAGVVVATGVAVNQFKTGDRVFYAGDISRPGCNSQLHVVEEFLIGHMPASLDFADAAALPLTSITAWESLFDRLRISLQGADRGKRILIVGGAGGVASIAIQLAKRVAGLQVIATASREDTRHWVAKMGADQIINHRQPLDDELARIHIPQVDYILCCNATRHHWKALCNAVAPQGHICSIVDTEVPVALELLKPKSASFSWEHMFTRSFFKTDDRIEQQRLLNRVAEQVDDGTLQVTRTQTLSPINAVNLREAHRLLESGTMIGKLVLEGWD